MKMIIFRYGNRSNRQKPGVRLSMERILFLSCLTVFGVLIIAQAALTNPSMRAVLNSDASLEGTPLGIEEFLYKEGELVLMLVDNANAKDVKVLVNGETVGGFEDNQLKVTVKNGDVVELDGSGSENGGVVEIISKSDNIKTECLNKTLEVSRSIKQLVKVRVE